MRALWYWHFRTSMRCSVCFYSKAYLDRFVGASSYIVMYLAKLRNHTTLELHQRRRGPKICLLQRAFALLKFKWVWQYLQKTAVENPNHIHFLLSSVPTGTLNFNSRRNDEYKLLLCNSRQKSQRWENANYVSTYSTGSEALSIQ